MAQYCIWEEASLLPEGVKMPNLAIFKGRVPITAAQITQPGSEQACQRGPHFIYD